MQSTAAPILANGHIGDLIAEANRERLARQVRRKTPRSTADDVAVDGLLVKSRRILRSVRTLPRATAVCAIIVLPRARG